MDGDKSMEVSGAPHRFAIRRRIMSIGHVVLEIYLDQF
jgi:hypothetical protein